MILNEKPMSSKAERETGGIKMSGIPNETAITGEKENQGHLLFSHSRAF